MSGRTKLAFALSLALNLIFLLAVAGVVWSKGGVWYLGYLWGRSLYGATDPQHDADAKPFGHLPGGDLATVFLGDSLTRHLPWAEFVTDVRNRGIGRMTAQRLAHEWPDLLAGNPRQVILLVGINDLLGGAPSAAVGDRIIQICSALQAKTEHVVLVSVLPIDPSALESPKRGVLNGSIRDVNAKLRAFAAPVDGVRFVDAFAGMADERGALPPSLHIGDGLHLSSQGMVRLVDIVEPTLLPRGAAGDRLDAVGDDF